MNTLSILAPLLAALSLVGALTTMYRRLSPERSARVLTASVVLILAAAIPTVVILGLSFLTHLPLVGNGMQWCSELVGVHDAVPAVLGLPAIVAIIAGTIRGARLLVLHQRLVEHSSTEPELTPHDQPFAVTLPGRGGHIIVSTGLADLLDETELDVVIAHELAHARNRHDRYLLVAKLASATLPPLKPLAKRIEFSLERWADEAAAAACGSRELVAHTLAKVAIGAPIQEPALGFTGLGVTARMQALLTPTTVTSGAPARAGLCVAMAATATMAAVQLHHLAALVAALCPN
jgi:Zn-dependent protease with chaperone function